MEVATSNVEVPTFPRLQCRKFCLGAVLLVIWGAAPRPAAAQWLWAPWVSDSTAFEGADRRAASLVGWRDEIRTAVLDRKHAYGGLFFDRGMFRRLTPAMDHEYDIDLLTYAYSPADDAEWYGSDHAVRTYMGSIHKSHFATRTRTRHRLALDDRNGISFSAMQQEDLSAQRFFVEFGYSRSLSDRQRIGFRQTVAAYKPDLDFSAYYTFSAPTVGAVQVELGLLDVANNLIFDRLRVDPVLEDTVRSYGRRPFLLDVYWRTPTVRRFRAEVSAGMQPHTRARVQSQGLSDVDFAWREGVHYIGGLLEYSHAIAAGGLILRHTFSSTGRISNESSPNETDYKSRQSSRSATLYVLAPLWRLSSAVWVTGEFYNDEQVGTAFDEASIQTEFDYFEGRLTAQARLQFVPERGLRGGVDYLLDVRRFYRGAALMNSYLRFLPWSPNGRLAMHVGYQFSTNAFVVIGASYDLGGDPFYGDGRGPVRYDGGFGRAAFTW